MTAIARAIVIASFVAGTVAAAHFHCNLLAFVLFLCLIDMRVEGK
ncbi:hypothetical protein [Chitinasiproducens palmae]|uniref:Uncharacterized protein n=1 Tax=Chitinasiproducens palmae TaxID=1770053 RepID=A0A1H2PQU0_9BURK|nr:hypothetical protein [Chitinasiproducens palmae]SDV49214.1 hypothetical protein SAMN05216551_107157 [Chitinasiproducens palmae]